MVEVGVNGADFQGGYYCLRRRSDGAVYWTTTVSELAFDGSIWEDCTPDDPATVPPPPCFAVQCERAPRSLCTFAETVDAFGCGALNGEWDEACCARRRCQDASDCSAAEDCVAVGTIASWDCWPTSSDSCDCGGTFGGPSRTVCLPR